MDKESEGRGWEVAGWLKTERRRDVVRCDFLLESFHFEGRHAFVLLSGTGPFLYLSLGSRRVLLLVWTTVVANPFLALPSPRFFAFASEGGGEETHPLEPATPNPFASPFSCLVLSRVHSSLIPPQRNLLLHKDGSSVSSPRGRYELIVRAAIISPLQARILRRTNENPAARGCPLRRLEETGRVRSRSLSLLKRWEPPRKRLSAPGALTPHTLSRLTVATHGNEEPWRSLRHRAPR